MTLSRNDLAWAALIAATLLTWILGVDHDSGPGTAQASVVIALVLAFAKAFVVGREFMELRTAPRLLQGLFGGWIVVVGSGLIAIYLLG